MERSIEEQLGEIRAEMEKLRGRIQMPLPPVLQRDQAAWALSISKSTLVAMIRRGYILQTEKIGGRRLIPLSEIERLAKPAAPKPGGKKPAPRAPTSLEDELEVINAAMRRR